MKHIIKTAPFMEKVNEMRKAIEENLISLLEEHNAVFVDCFPIGSTPAVIVNPLDCDTFTLDTIVLHKNDDKAEIEFECSNSYTNEDVYLAYVSIEQLIDIYDWVKAYEVELFEERE